METKVKKQNQNSMKEEQNKTAVETKETSKEYVFEVKIWSFNFLSNKIVLNMFWELLKTDPFKEKMLTWSTPWGCSPFKYEVDENGLLKVVTDCEYAEEYIFNYIDKYLKRLFDNLFVPIQINLKGEDTFAVYDVTNGDSKKKGEVSYGFRDGRFEKITN